MTTQEVGPQTQRAPAFRMRFPSRVIAALGVLWAPVLLMMFYSNSRSAARHAQAMMRQRAESLAAVVLAGRCWERGPGGPHAVEPGSVAARILNGEPGLHVQVHLATWNHVSPAAPPDAWESDALRSLRQGGPAQGQLGGGTFRYMAPLRFGSDCLSCHHDGSHRAGELLGGAGVSFAADSYLASQSAEIRGLGLRYALMGLFGFGGLVFSGRRLLREDAGREAGLRTRYQELFEEAPVAYHEVGVDGSVIAVNKAESVLLGLEREALIGRPYWESISPASSGESFQKKLTGREPLPVFESRYERPDGAVLTLEVHENRLYGPGGEAIGIRSATLDVSGRKEKEEELARRTAELARSNAELEQFAYIASHDLQEPLRMVSSYTQLLARRYQGKLGHDADEFIAFAVDGAARMSQLINDLLNYSRVGSRKGEFRAVNADTALTAALANLRAAIGESGAVIHRSLLPAIEADPAQLAQIFQNLLGNAIKFHNGVRPEIRVACEDTPQEWSFSVSDNGIGIDPKHAAKIFQVFQRLHTKQEYPGTGIGLAICKKIAERHGGRIWVVSEPGQGATFHFTIRKKKEDAQ